MPERVSALPVPKADRQDRRNGLEHDPSAFIAVHLSVSRTEECPRQLSLSVVLQGGRSSWKTLSKTITGA
jgi:hypothetical protein